MCTDSICAWCEKSLQDNTINDPKVQNITHGICVDCIIELNVFPNDNLEDLSREEIDNLPYGTIILDKNDRVLWYNKKEEDITGFSASNVEGKLFFTEVAPCTSVKEFQGNLNKLKQNNDNSTKLIDFTFTHPKFRARVKIAIRYLTDQAKTILIIRRKQSRSGY